MKVQFCYESASPTWSNDIVAEFDVAEMPTDEQCKAIEDEVYDKMNKWDEEHDDFIAFDYWNVCYQAVKKHLKIVDNQVVKTFYL
jgi:hypothetical protein